LSHFRADSNPAMPSSGVGNLPTPHRSPQVPHGLSVGDTGGLGAGNPTVGGNISGFDLGLQAEKAITHPYQPMIGRADKHSSNIVGSGQNFGPVGISSVHGAGS
jgi:hypothetical protein